MTLDPRLRARLVLPAFCAPMHHVSGRRLLAAACKAGIAAGTNPMNWPDAQAFEADMLALRRELDAHQAEHPGARIGPLATNLNLRAGRDETARYLAICKAARVDIVVSVAGDPTRLIEQVHEHGGVVWHDATSLRFAEKAIRAGADGIIAIGAGGGGHSGTVTPLALIPQIRAMFDGTIVMAGAVAHGAAIRAAEVLGADLAYLGTRFIATQESDAPQAYKQMLVDADGADLAYTPAVNGVPANWLLPSLRAHGVDTQDLRIPAGARHLALPPGTLPWRDVWSAGQGVGLVRDIPTVAELVLRLRREYAAACSRPALGL
ncbi:NAD(P)H-dependent flavin oxidoreductase [Pseudorhodoferax sp.]|uniref:NAD(P)H-dependent flavin oxidoreductase n=1 Tax=Pseudorhodoferax sp. TaxID=1993553 RepID=UPI002DD6ACFE|nr:nitronate monooxygenase [Pseudorhodoferax sp.]